MTTGTTGTILDIVVLFTNLASKGHDATLPAGDSLVITTRADAWVDSICRDTTRAASLAESSSVIRIPASVEVAGQKISFRIQSETPIREAMMVEIDGFVLPVRLAPHGAVVHEHGSPEIRFATWNVLRYVRRRPNASRIPLVLSGTLEDGRPFVSRAEMNPQNGSRARIDDSPATRRGTNLRKTAADVDRASVGRDGIDDSICDPQGGVDGLREPDSRRRQQQDTGQGDRRNSTPLALALSRAIDHANKGADSCQPKATGLWSHRVTLRSLLTCAALVLEPVPRRRLRSTIEAADRRQRSSRGFLARSRIRESLLPPIE
jgi:hypothetical protein